LVVRDADRSAQSVMKQKKRTGKTDKGQSFLRSACRSVSQTNKKRSSEEGGSRDADGSFVWQIGLPKQQKRAEKQRSVRSSSVSFRLERQKRRGKRRRCLRSFVRRIGLPKPNKKGAQKQRGCLVVRDANRSVSQSVTKQKKRTGKTGKRQSFVRSTCRSVSQTKQKKLRGGGTPTVPSFGKLVCRNKRSSEKQRSVRSSGVSFRLK